jgi:hypothetical protein
MQLTNSLEINPLHLGLKQVSWHKEIKTLITIITHNLRLTLSDLSP